MDLRGKTAIVTGMTGGLGSRIARALVLEGANVVGVYQNSREKAQALADELSKIGPCCLAAQADITTQEGIDRMVAVALEAYGGVDILINNAAYNRWIPFNDLDTLTGDVFRYILEYNVMAPYLASRTVAPIMKKQGSGRIVNIASVAGLKPSGSSMAYATSKSALIHLTRCLAVGLAPEIIVNSVSPGLMDGTRMTANLAPEYAEAARQGSALHRAASKDDVADAVVLFCKTDSVTGQTLVVDSGSTYH